MKKYQVKISGQSITMLAASSFDAICQALDIFPSAYGCSAKLVTA